MFSIENFIKDYLQLSPFGFSEKYFLKIPKFIKVSDVIDFLEKSKALESMIDRLNDDSKDVFGSIYVIQLPDGSYEYFEYEDKGKMYSCVFADLKEALAEKVKNIFLQLGHSA